MPKKKEDSLDIAVEVDERFRKILQAINPDTSSSDLTAEIKKHLTEQLELMKLKSLLGLVKEMGGNSNNVVELLKKEENSSILEKLDPEVLANLDQEKLQQLITLELMRSGKIPVQQNDKSDKLMMLLMMYMMNNNKTMTELLIKTLEAVMNKPQQQQDVSSALSTVLDKMKETYDKMFELVVQSSSSNKDTLAEELAKNYLEMLRSWAQQGAEDEIERTIKTIEKLKPIIEAFKQETTDPKVLLELKKLEADLLNKQRELELKRELEMKKLELETKKIEEDKKKEDNLRELVSDVLVSLANAFESMRGGSPPQTSTSDMSGIYLPIYCPNCSAKFTVPMKAFTDELPVRCPHCSYTFIPRIAGEPYEVASNESEGSSE